MAKKDRTATDELNVALAGLDSALTILEQVRDDPKQFEKVIAMAKEYGDDARKALMIIKTHASKI